LSIILPYLDKVQKDTILVPAYLVCSNLALFDATCVENLLRFLYEEHARVLDAELPLATSRLKVHNTAITTESFSHAAHYYHFVLSVCSAAVESHTFVRERCAYAANLGTSFAYLCEAAAAFSLSSRTDTRTPALCAAAAIALLVAIETVGIPSVFTTFVSLLYRIWQTPQQLSRNLRQNANLPRLVKKIATTHISLLSLPLVLLFMCEVYPRAADLMPHEEVVALLESLVAVFQQHKAAIAANEPDAGERMAALVNVRRIESNRVEAIRAVG